MTGCRRGVGPNNPILGVLVQEHLRNRVDDRLENIAVHMHTSEANGMPAVSLDGSKTTTGRPAADHDTVSKMSVMM